MKQKSEQLRQLSTLKHDRIIHPTKICHGFAAWRTGCWVCCWVCRQERQHRESKAHRSSVDTPEAGSPKVHEFLLNCKSSPDFSRQHDTHCNVTPTVLKTFKKSSKRMMRSGIRRLLWQKINFHFGSAMQCCSYAIKVHIDIALHKSRLRDAICEEDTSSLTSFIT